MILWRPEADREYVADFGREAEIRRWLRGEFFPAWGVEGRAERDCCRKADQLESSADFGAEAVVEGGVRARR